MSGQRGSYESCHEQRHGGHLPGEQTEGQRGRQEPGHYQRRERRKQPAPWYPLQRREACEEPPTDSEQQGQEPFRSGTEGALTQAGQAPALGPKDDEE